MIEAVPNDLLHVTLASIGDAVIATDPEGRVTFLNAVAESLTGWHTGDASGRPLTAVFRILNEHTREPVENPVDKVLRLGRTVGLANHTVLISKNGSEVPIDDSAAPIRGADGRMRGVVLIFRDITERKQAEDAAAERHRTTALRADIGSAFATDQTLQAGLQACCEAFVHHLGMAFTRIWILGEGEDVLELRASAGLYTHLDGAHSRVKVGELKIGKIAATRQPHLTNDIANDQNISDQEWAETNDMVAFAGYPLLVDGHVLGVIAMFACERLSVSLQDDLVPLADQVAQHIERKRAEQRLRESELRYRLIGQAANDAIWDWDLVTNRVVWNEGVQSRFGYRFDQIGEDASWWIEHIHESDQQRISQGIHDVIDSGELWQDEYRFRRADGTYATVFDRGRVVRDEDGKPTRMVGSMLDLSERLLAERKLHFTLEAAGIGQWELDLRSDKSVRTPLHDRIFGYASPPLDWSYDRFLNGHVHPDDRQRVDAAFQAAMESRSEWDFECRIIRTDDALRWIWAKGTIAERDEESLPLRMVGIVMDVTARKEASHALRQSEDLLRFQLDLTSSITSNATTPIFMMDDKSRCTFMNPAAEAMTGYAFAEVEGEILHDFIHHHRPDGSPYPMTECPIDRALPEHFEVRNHEDLFFRKNGEAFPVNCNARVIYKEGRAVGTVIEVRDMTADLKAAEATRKRSDQLRRLADVATRIGVAHDVASVMGIVTQEVRHVIEAHQSVASMTVDQDWAQAITAVSMSEKYGHWQKYDKPPDGSGIYSLVCRTNRPMRLTQAELEVHPAWKRFGGDKEHPPMRGWLAAPLVGRDGQNLGLIQISDKVDGEFTEDDEAVLVQLAQMASVAVENARLVESLRNADRRKDEFLATLAHELRNPLAPIRMGLEILKLGGDDATALAEIRNMMERQTQQLITLVDDLLDVSRITQGKLELRKCRVTLSDVVRSAVEASRPLIDESGHQLTLGVPERPIYLEADPNRLAQVISNLLNNAAKYTPDKGQIRLSVERQGSDVQISVIDNGIGIPLEMQRQVFEMFAQIDRPLEKGYVGLGIGLTLVKRLVEMHDGSVEVSSEGSGKGSEFRVRLPILLEQRGEDPIAGPTLPGSGRVKRRILVVDDNKAAADTLMMVVKLLGNDVRTAGDGQEAVEVAAQFLPDVVLMDIGMPKLNGYEAARHIRQQPWGERMLLIALTGWGQEEDRQRTRAAGFDHHLVKPAEPAELQRLLAVYASRSE